MIEVKKKLVREKNFTRKFGAIYSKYEIELEFYFSFVNKKQSISFKFMQLVTKYVKEIEI